MLEFSDFDLGVVEVAFAPQANSQIIGIAKGSSNSNMLNIFIVDNQFPRETDSMRIYRQPTHDYDSISLQLPAAEQLGTVYWVNTDEVIHVDAMGFSPYEWYMKISSSAVGCKNVDAVYTDGLARLDVAQYCASAAGFYGVLYGLTSPESELEDSISYYLEFESNLSDNELVMEYSGSISVYEETDTSSIAVAYNYN